MDINVFHQLPEDAARIRVEIFVDEQGFTEEFDSDDKEAIHFVGYSDGKAVATCRIIKRNSASFFIGRIAVIKVFRGKGFGSLIVKAAKTILIHSQLQAADFYEKLGYVKTGETDIEEGCPHCMMLKQI